MLIRAAAAAAVYSTNSLGIASALVAAAEEYLLSLAADNDKIVHTAASGSITTANAAVATSSPASPVSPAASTATAVKGRGVMTASMMREESKISRVRMEMGVINLRTELFPFYQKRGYVVVSLFDLPVIRVI